MNNDSDPDVLDSPDQKLRRWGAMYHTCVWYPGISRHNSDTPHAIGFAIDLIAVRSAPGVHVTFDMSKNKWVISTDDGTPASEWIEMSDTPVCVDGNRQHQKSTSDGQTMCDNCGFYSPEDAAAFEKHLEATRTWRRP